MGAYLYLQTFSIAMCCYINVFVVRQLMLLTAICLVAITSGIQLAFPSVLNPAILGLDSTIKATSEEASWIAASLGIGGIVSYTFLPIVFDVFGRRVNIFVMNFFMIVGSLIFCVANDVYILAFARFVQGLGYGGSFSSVMTLSECVPPKRRGYFMVINKISVGFGALVCHSLGFVLNWTQIAVYGALPNGLSIILLLVTRESPSFFAHKANFEKCEEAFKWYRGDSHSARKELKELVVAQKENCRLKQSENNLNIFKKTKNMLLTKEFRKSFYIVTLATLCIDSCGKVFMFAYVTQILLELTKNKSLAMYISLASDAILICALSVSSILVTHFNRRTLLFRLGFCSAFLMFIISLMNILSNNISLFEDMKLLIAFIILFHIFITNIGVVPVAFALTGEVFSLDQRAFGSMTSGFVFLFFFNVVMKITPTLIDNTGVEGTYFIYGSCLIIFLLLLRNVLPETKDKTLQAIEDAMKGIVRNDCEVELMQVNTKS